MGKAQSKRSVDITTEDKNASDDVIAEKLGKIEDEDQKQLNGVAEVASMESKSEKKAGEGPENEKDLTTEKKPEIAGDVDNTKNDIIAAGVVENIPVKKEEEVAGAQEMSPLGDESAKKSKKEKVKKKWSFRNISFGKKDKQKPLRTDGSIVETLAGASTIASDIASNAGPNENLSGNEQEVKNGPKNPKEGEVAVGIPETKTESLEYSKVTENPIISDTVSSPLTTEETLDETIAERTSAGNVVPPESVVAVNADDTNPVISLNDDVVTKIGENMLQNSNTTPVPEEITNNGITEGEKENGLVKEASESDVVPPNGDTKDIIVNNDPDFNTDDKNKVDEKPEKPEHNGTNGNDAEIEIEGEKSELETTEDTGNDAKALKEFTHAEIKSQDISLACE